MTSRRMLKKKINAVMNNIIEECYSLQLMSNGNKDNETNKIIDDAVALFDDLLQRMNSAKEIGDRKKMKTHFEKINQDLEKSSLELMGRMNKI